MQRWILCVLASCGIALQAAASLPKPEDRSIRYLEDFSSESYEVLEAFKANLKRSEAGFTTKTIVLAPGCEVYTAAIECVPPKINLKRFFLLVSNLTSADNEPLPPQATAFIQSYLRLACTTVFPFTLSVERATEYFAASTLIDKEKLALCDNISAICTILYSKDAITRADVIKLQELVELCGEFFDIYPEPLAAVTKFLRACHSAGGHLTAGTLLDYARNHPERKKPLVSPPQINKNAMTLLRRRHGEGLSFTPSQKRIVTLNALYSPYTNTAIAADFPLHTIYSAEFRAIIPSLRRDYASLERKIMFSPSERALNDDELEELAHLLVSLHLVITVFIAAFEDQLDQWPAIAEEWTTASGWRDYLPPLASLLEESLPLSEAGCTAQTAQLLLGTIKKPCEMPDLATALALKLKLLELTQRSTAIMLGSAPTAGVVAEMQAVIREQESAYAEGLVSTTELDDLFSYLLYQ